MYDQNVHFNLSRETQCAKLYQIYFFVLAVATAATYQGTVSCVSEIVAARCLL